MFHNLFFLYGKGLNLVTRQVCKKIIEKYGGQVTKRSKYPVRFQKASGYSTLDGTITHILVNDRNIGEADLFNYLECHGLPPHVKVVHWSWLEACVQAKGLCDTTAFHPPKFSNKRGVKRSYDSTSVTATNAIPPPLSTTFVPPVATGYTPPITSILNLPTSTTPIPTTSITTLPTPTIAAPKRGKGCGIDCIDTTSHSFASGMIQSMGNGWFLLHNTIDGDRTPSLLFKFSPVQRQCSSVVGFDMDGTIITTKSGKNIEELNDLV